MVYLIYGSPCAGKSTYAETHAGENDIILDCDKLYAAICTRDMHDINYTQYGVACWLRETLYDIIRDRKGRWENAYVIHTAATPGELLLAIKRVNADEAVLIDTPQEVCMERAAERGGNWKKIAERWWGRYEATQKPKEDGP